jgi:hypothetical protein
VVLVVMLPAILLPKSYPQGVSACRGVVAPKTKTRILPNNHKPTTRQVPSRRTHRPVPVLLVVTKGSRISNTREEEEDVIRIAVVVVVADEAVEMVAVVAVATAFEDEAVEMAIEMAAVAEVADGVAAAAAAKEPAVGLLNPRLTKHTWKSTN